MGGKRHDQTTNRPSGQGDRDGLAEQHRRLGVAQWRDRVCAAGGGLEFGLVGWWWRDDGDSVQKVQMQDDDDRRNAARTSARACRRRFLCAVNEWNRKIVINAHTALVADCGGSRNEATHQTT